MGIRRSHKQKQAEATSVSDKPASVEASQDASPSDLPEELVAARAYEKWQLRGCPMGHDGSQDWFAARNELELERLNWAAPQPDDALRGVGK
jgi:hypothetical protein